MKQCLKLKRNSVIKRLRAGAIFALTFGVHNAAMAKKGGGSSSQSLGDVASSITSSMNSVTLLLTAGSYVAGIGFAVGAIMKFKQHKDNPQQVTIGTCIGMTLVAAALLFLPSILGVAGSTIFGGGASTAGPGGTIIS